MDIINWDLVLHHVLPTYLFLGSILSIGGVLASFVPAFKITKKEIIFGMLLLLIVVFLLMIVLAILKVHFPFLRKF